jgi:pro-apoptotic serine protease NMA111
MLYWTRDDAMGAWNCTEDWPPCLDVPPALPPCSPLEESKPEAKPITLQDAMPPASSPCTAPKLPESSSATQADIETGDELGQAYDEMMQRCLVLLEVDIPLVALADGVHSRCFTGTAGTGDV